MERKNNLNHPSIHQTPPSPKISQNLLGFAGDFIRMGKTLEERQNRLTAACSAWNMACNKTPELRKKHLDQYVRGYGEFNLGTDAEDLAGIRKDMEMLIEVKLKMFIHDRRQVLDARIISEGGKDRVEAVAAVVQ